MLSATGILLLVLLVLLVLLLLLVVVVVVVVLLLLLHCVFSTHRCFMRRLDIRVEGRGSGVESLGFEGLGFRA